MYIGKEYLLYLVVFIAYNKLHIICIIVICKSCRRSYINLICNISACIFTKGYGPFVDVVGNGRLTNSNVGGCIVLIPNVNKNGECVLFCLFFLDYTPL